MKTELVQCERRRVRKVNRHLIASFRRAFSICAVLLVAIGSSQAQSLWHARAADRVNLVSDTASRRVGDLVTILIQENTDVANNDTRNLAKDSEGGFSFDFASSTSTPANVEMSGKSDRNFNGQSQYSVAQEFTDRMTLEVLDVLPNGNLVLGGQRERVVAGERRTLVVSGIVRTIDVSPNNTVSSQHVANFKVSYDGNGPESKFTNQGWAAKVLTRFWPF